MQSVYGFIVKPKGQRYNNTASVGNKSLILNTEMYNHSYVNRLAEVIACPKVGDDMGIKPGDTVIVHHNVFRRWQNVKGIEKNSKNFFKEGIYIINNDQIFLYRKINNSLRHKAGPWQAPSGYCFVKPIKAVDQFNVDAERPLMGIVKYSDGTVDVNDLVGFRPSSEYEFVVDGERLYRVLSKFITIKYEYQGDEEEYNPSWS